MSAPDSKRPQAAADKKEFKGILADARRAREVLSQRSGSTPAQERVS